MANTQNADELRQQWLARLADLVQTVQHWTEELGWTTRKIEIAKEDSQIGKYRAPALLLQQEATRVLLEPVARSAPGAEGVVDLYLMPAYDDIASLYFYSDAWHLHYAFAEEPAAATIREAEAKPLTEETLRDVLEAMRKHAVDQI
jgi:hypothetical protein